MGALSTTVSWRGIWPRSGPRGTLGALGLMVLVAFPACTRRDPPTSASPHLDSSAPSASAPSRFAPSDFAPWPGLPVRDPWKNVPAGQRDARTRALENVGPNEPRDSAAFENTNAVYWTDLVDLAFRRDVSLDFDHEPVDLDDDGLPDTEISRHIRAPGGILANPELFGLVTTPDDPAGTPGRVSVSTGVLGLRETLDEQGRPTGKVGMTCFLCHGAKNPADGRIALGLPNPALDYGLLLATARVLSDQTEPVAFRRAHNFPPGRTVRAHLLMAGPGRQDLTGEFGLDITVPGARSPMYPGTARVRQRTRGLVNPLSVPSALGVEGVDLQNWSGSEVASERWVTRLMEAPRAAEGPQAVPESARGDLLRAFRLPTDDPSATRRALLLDLRNLGTLGLQQDSWPGLLFADALYGFASVQRDDLSRLHALYAAADVRETLASETKQLKRPPSQQAAVDRGRRLFFDQPAGRVANLRILKEAPPAYASSHLASPMLAPLFAGRELGEVLPVRCGDCHNATPGETKSPFAVNPTPTGRCTSCHRAHPEEADVPAAFDSLLARSAADEARLCLGCHQQHRTFSPVSFSNSALLPFDADRDGRAQDDEADDARAGGVGTESWLAFDVPRPEWGAEGFHLRVAVIADPRHPGPVKQATLGAAWVRVPPLLGVFATAPYLHNGSVPTLEALLTAPSRRPRSFALGAAGFVFDTRLPGNRSCGHDFGTHWSPRQKADIVAFLRSL